MKHFGLLFLLYAALVVQAGFAERCVVAGIAVQPLLVAAALAMLWAEGAAAFLYAALAGLCMDALGEDPLGLVMLSATFAAIVAHQAVGRSAPARQKVRSSAIWMACGTFAAVLAMVVCASMLRSVLLRHPIRSLDLVNHAAATAGCAAALVFACGVALQLIVRLLPLPRRRVDHQWSTASRWRTTSD
jgi:hypothetical protein